MLRVLLDEGVPQPLQEPLNRLLQAAAQVDHVNDVAKSMPDNSLIAWASRHQYEVFVTPDFKQLDDPAETAAIKKSGIHHVRFHQQTGMKGLGLAMAAVLAAMPDVVAALEQAPCQRLVRIDGLDPGRTRHTIIDPNVDPPAYWRGRARRTNSRKK